MRFGWQDKGAMNPAGGWSVPGSVGHFRSRRDADCAAEMQMIIVADLGGFARDVKF
jgi:hypothetical protein